MPELRREDVPEQLRPTFDAMTLAAHEGMHRAALAHRRAARWYMFGAGMFTASSLMNIAVVVIRQIS